MVDEGLVLDAHQVWHAERARRHLVVLLENLGEGDVVEVDVVLAALHQARARLHLCARDASAEGSVTNGVRGGARIQPPVTPRSRPLCARGVFMHAAHVQTQRDTPLLARRARRARGHETAGAAFQFSRCAAPSRSAGTWAGSQPLAVHCLCTATTSFTFWSS
eukprot:427725-Prymnesium_polylepis.1